MNFQEMIHQLLAYWQKQGCLVQQGHDLEVGAGTLNPSTFLRCLGPEPYSTVYVEPSRRPKDGRYGENPNRVQFYHQMQVIIKPSPLDIKELYLGSLKAIGVSPKEHDIRFVHDDWENPTIGAWGLGWEVWADGMEVTQFTYFQAVGGIPVNTVTGEITYGLERLAMYVQGVDSVFDLKYNDEITYGEIFLQNEQQWSEYNFHASTGEMWLRHFEDYEKEVHQLVEKKLPIPAYDFVLKSSHAFNMLDARGMLSVSERARYIARVRHLAKEVAQSYLESREKLGFPLLKTQTQKSYPQPELPVKEGSNKEKETFLLEIGVEELPATFVPIGMKQLEQHIAKFLHEHHLDYEQIKVYGTPRRLAIQVTQLIGATSEKQYERKGPAINAAFDSNGSLTKAGLGFVSTLGLDTLNLGDVQSGKVPGLSIQEVKQTPYLFLSFTQKGLSTRKLLCQHLPSLILNLHFPKKMRWSTLSIEFPRPIKWLVALYGEEILPFSIAFYTANRRSFGHSTLAAEPFEIKHANHYEELLKNAYVLVDPKARRAVIQEALDQSGYQALAKESVMNQVVHLVEWPYPFIGTFDRRYLKAPQQVLISEMVEHQKYFPLADMNGTLQEHFMVVSNIPPTPLIQHGHQCALSPRLADGNFLFEEDLKTPLDTFVKGLERVTYQADLGSLAQKKERLTQMALFLQKTLSLSSSENVKRAATLAKADLVSQLVGEFPELQGVIGHLYAKKHGEPSEVALAIEEHWMPRGEKDALPSSPCGCVISLADKFDTLTAHFSIGLKPTSSSDPYALRRQALGILKILLEHKHTLSLSKTFHFALSLLPEKESKETVARELMLFMSQRLRILLEDYHFQKDEIEACLGHSFDDPYAIFQKLQALQTFKQSGKLEPLAEAYHRVRKLLLSQKKEERSFDAHLLKEMEEKALFNALSQLSISYDEEWESAFVNLTNLVDPINGLFDQVKVIADDPATKANRLALLTQIKERFDRLIDFSKLQSVD